jgi:hypothetical protein
MNAVAQMSNIHKESRDLGSKARAYVMSANQGFDPNLLEIILALAILSDNSSTSNRVPQPPPHRFTLLLNLKIMSELY